MLKVLNPVELSVLQRSFLDGVPNDDHSANSIPVYVRVGEDYAFVQGVHCPYGRRNEFKLAPEGLFLSGVSIFILVKQGICVVPDRRFGGVFQATAQGWAIRGEGGLPEHNALRELGEEAYVYTVDDTFNMSCKVELVPQGMSPRGRIPSINLELPNFREFGNIRFLRVNENHAQRVIEFVYCWDLRDVSESICLIHDDDLPWGGFIGSNPVVLDYNGKLTHICSGQQGILPLDLAMHSVIAQSWGDLTSL